MAIIKCPECGHEVSDAAERCPNCGVAIAGNIKVCPDCGRVVLKNATTCPSCGAKFQVPVEGDARARKGNREARASQYSNLDPYAPDGKKKRSNKGIIIGLVVAVVVVGLGVLAYMLISKSQREASEQECYEDVVASSDTALYNQYLEDYPDGKHAAEVKSRLQELVAELNDWNDACVNNTKGGFVAFLNNHKNSPFEQACKEKIDSLDFIDALTANTAEALQRYIGTHPDGKYIEQATQAQNNLDALKVKSDEMWQIKKVCTSFFAALEQKDEQALASTVAAVMDNFLNKQNATHADVVTFANRLSANQQHMVLTVNDDYKVRKVATDTGEFAYEVSFSVDENSTDAEGKENISTYAVSAHINPQMKISSLNMKRLSSGEDE